MQSSSIPSSTWNCLDRETRCKPAFNISFVQRRKISATVTIRPVVSSLVTGTYVTRLLRSSNSRPPALS